MNSGLSEKEIREHQGPLWSGKLIIEKVEGKWVPGGCPKQVTDRKSFADLCGMSARRLNATFGPIATLPYPKEQHRH